MSRHSHHRMANGEVKRLNRKWDPIHIAAGYAEQEFGEHSHNRHELLGTYDCKAMEPGTTVTVSHVDSGATGGPEFELLWSDGMAVTVLDDATAIAYLTDSGAIEITE